MKEMLDFVLLVAALTGLAVNVGVLLVLVLVVRILKTYIANLPQGCTHIWASTGTTTVPSTISVSLPTDPVPPASPVPPTTAAAPDDRFKCEHCGAPVEGDPVRQIVGDTGNFLVYVCPKCGQETAKPAAD